MSTLPLQQARIHSALRHGSSRIEQQGAIALSHWLRVLWGVAPPLLFDAEAAPWLSGGALHLPPQAHWLQHCAAATHAAAHLVYSPARFDGAGLAPLARALLALLEDARVETLACRELPGLARLWRPLHTATPEHGTQAEALLKRLARALADPCYADPHPWVAKGRKLFFLDAELGMPALRTPAELRAAALRLGHDLGQMRVQFNAGLYRPEPSFRDDHRWMWDADNLAETLPPPVSPSGDLSDMDDDDLNGSDQMIVRHPEWDRLINRLRPEWTTVIEQPLEASADAASLFASPSAARPSNYSDANVRHLGKRLLKPLGAVNRRATARRRSSEGDVFDIDALVERSVARRTRCTPDHRVYRGRRTQAERAVVWLLLDQSASTSAPMGGGSGGGSGVDGGHGVGRVGAASATSSMTAATATSDVAAGTGMARSASILDAAIRAAAATALALHAMDVDCVIAGFNSNGRHRVRLRTASGNEGLLERLQGLRSAGSTRLGAAIRHATARLAAHRAPVRWLLVLSDGEPHDIDVHDRRYLVEDARHAVREAARRSVRVVSLTLEPESRDNAGTSADARRIFGPRASRCLTTLDALPTLVRQLLA